MFDGEINRHDDWDGIAAELAAEPRLADLERALDHLIVSVGQPMQRIMNADRDTLDALIGRCYQRFRRGGWSFTYDRVSFDTWIYFDLTLSHPKHGSLFRQCCKPPGGGPRPCESIYSDKPSSGYDFIPSIKPDHIEATLKFLGEITVFMKMGLIGPNGRKLRAA